MKFPLHLVLFAVTMGLTAACGDEQSVDSGQPSPSNDGATGVIVTVTLENKSVPVDLGTLGTTAYKGVELVKLSDVWAASGIGVDPTTLEFEFVSADGFRPSSKGCDDLAGSNIDKGFIHPTSRNITWDETLGLRGCYAVNDTEQMNGHVPEKKTGDTDAADR
ncbi:MAG TPA: hypothetical protein PKL73_00195 [Polyangiaceae bacterium]|jgi:hypothetical protein|nr:MAG: hypothetical protein BWY17_01845 [Deltaproteobacteria bacterium ADurb.Bin207]HNS95338.1 hypothetical protein [Polyangiaceae bacterium]HNZ23174.1 hypothetical protein [Polyangiaceae bacterium]HOD24958.1 hypothetical protein [Polyangiaceae bacterium]HOE49790.1 hypothetical protein [Polyangiaceae bacterium]